MLPFHHFLQFPLILLFYDFIRNIIIYIHSFILYYELVILDFLGYFLKVNKMELFKLISKYDYEFLRFLN